MIRGKAVGDSNLSAQASGLKNKQPCNLVAFRVQLRALECFE